MPKLDGELFRTLVDLLIPFVGSKTEADAILKVALGSNSPVLARLNLDGVPPFERATVIVDRLSHDDLWAVLQQANASANWEATLNALYPRFFSQMPAQTAERPHEPHIELPEPTTSPRSRDHVFISYAHSDRALVEHLAQDLRERGHSVWIDFEGVRGGDIWRQSIADGIYASAIVLVMLSPDSVRSEWVAIEITAAKDAGKKLIPLLVRPFDTTDAEFAYRQLEIDHIQYRDFTHGYEAALQALLQDLPAPFAGIPAHCRTIAARLMALPWGLDHYIQEEAKLLPINASPYDEGGAAHQRENLLLRLKSGSRLIVLGEPGIGKTVALERLAWELATGDPLVVPVLIKLLEYDGQPLIEWIRLKLIETGEITLISHNQTGEYLRNMAFDCCILLDGLNEVRPTFRETLVGEITRFALEYTRHRVIVTSRVQDDSWRQLRQGSAFTETLVIQPILPADAQKYLAAHLGDEDSAALWNGLDQRMRDLALTPLLLWLIKETYLEEKATASGTAIRIPNNRGALYRKFVDRLLRRDDERGLSRKIPSQERQTGLERLALHLHQQQALTLLRDEAAQIVGGGELLEALLVNGLLTGENQIRFAPHQTIQEHFAARAIEERVMISTKATGWAKLARRTGLTRPELHSARDPWWWETFIQLAGLTEDGNALALALAEINPWLAWWCLEEGGKFDKQVRAKIGNRSQALVYSSKVSDRRAAVNTLARMKSPRVRQYLAHLSFDADEDILRTALRALVALGEDGIAAFLNTFSQQMEMIKPTERAAWGRAAHDIDPRSGVGLTPNGLPDIAWGDPVLPGVYPVGHESVGDNPARQFQLTYSYQLAKYPVTYAQFQAFLDAEDGFQDARWWHGLADDEYRRQNQSVPDEQQFKFWNHPRENVSWYDALAFCRWLSWRLGGGYDLDKLDEWAVRLPTETEWEIAARGTDGRVYPYEGDFNAAKDNTHETGIRQTSAVGIFPNGASPSGVLDMSGNVWEWCLTDYYNPALEAASENLHSAARRGMRGGSWDFDQDSARAVYRVGDDPFDRDGYLGFRVCRPPSR